MYASYAQNTLLSVGYRIQRIRMDGVGDNMADELVYFCKKGNLIKTSPSYGPESNGVAERLVQEQLTRARVPKFSTTLPK